MSNTLVAKFEKSHYSHFLMRLLVQISKKETHISISWWQKPRATQEPTFLIADTWERVVIHVRKELDFFLKKEMQLGN